MTEPARRETDATTSERRGAARPAAKRQTIRPCDFRSTVRLSSASAQHLTTLHESFARMATSELDLYLSESMQIKLLSIEQFGVRDYIAGAAPTGYLLPYTIAPSHGKMIMEFDSELLSSMIGLLLGGDGKPGDQERELTDLDEELLKSITKIIIERLELAWRLDNVALIAERSVKPSFVLQIFPAEAKVILLMFEVKVGESAGTLNLVLPHSFANFLVRNTQISAKKRVPLDAAGVRQSTTDKLMECFFSVTTELAGSTVPVHELIALKCGSVLELRVPLSNPVKLIIEGQDIFQVTPVRSGKFKAAQLGVPLPGPPADQDYSGSGLKP